MRVLNTYYLDDLVEEKEGCCALMCVRHVHVVRNMYMAVRSVSSFLPFKEANTVQCIKYLFSDSFADLESSNTYIEY